MIISHESGTNETFTRFSGDEGIEPGIEPDSMPHCVLDTETLMKGEKRGKPATPHRDTLNQRCSLSKQWGPAQSEAVHIFLGHGNRHDRQQRPSASSAEVAVDLPRRLAGRYGSLTRTSLQSQPCRFKSPKSSDLPPGAPSL